MLDLIKNVEVQAIIGPQNSMEANFVINLGKKAQVPIISFSATSPSLTSLSSPYFFRVAQNDSSQLKAICAVIQAFGWREVAPIYIDNDYGQSIIPFLIDALHDLTTMQTRVFIVHTPPNLGSQLFTKAKEIGMMSEDYVWIMTSTITNSIHLIEPLVLRDSMQGVLGVKTNILETSELKNSTIRWKRQFHQDNPTILNVELDVIGLWAYDAASALTREIEKAWTTNLGFEKTTTSSNSADLAISLNGPKLSKALLSTRFNGLAGEFSLHNGQQQSSNLINNIHLQLIAFFPLGNFTNSQVLFFCSDSISSNIATSYLSLSFLFVASLKVNGFPLLVTRAKLTMSSKRYLCGAFDSRYVPKSWEIPPNGKKLRIGVPVKDACTEFVKVTYDPSTNTAHVTGYSIDIFKAVMETLPNAVSYLFIPFAKPNGDSAGTYNDLVYQVYFGNFDVVEGDTTIIANRSNYVDFTLPYTESGVTMVVPINDNNRKNAWVFLKPLTWDLWMTSGCFFVFIGFVVWVLEHRVNDEFRGPPLHEIGTRLWYSFSTMVFAQREALVSNFARFVVIIWVFVVLILTQSYTASLASLLTVQQLQPTITDVQQLIKSGAYVGYHEASFAYKSIEECDELLSKGSANGGIAAAFDNTPCLKLFQRKYCSKYTIVGSIYKTDGLGFVSSLSRSPLASDVSRAILNVTEGEKMKENEKAWLGEQTNFPDSNTQDSSGSLSFASFSGLFLIAGIASLSALIISVSMFLYKERQQILIRFNSESSIRRKIYHTLRIFDRRGLNSHAFRKSAPQNGIDSDHVIGTSGASTNTNCPQNSSRFLVHTKSHFSFSEESGMPTRESGDPNPNGQAFQLALAIELSNHPNQESKNSRKSS
ncbi:hypothetical protein ACJW30_12G142800 [Castanea mollissima]